MAIENRTPAARRPLLTRLIPAVSAVIAAVGLAALAGCDAKDEFSEEEKAVIASAGENGVMRVLTIEDSTDLAVLRSVCDTLSADILMSKEFAELSRQMIATVTSPEQDGVGIAGPQIGLKRRVIAVQRFDKEGEPFEVYPNVRIISYSSEMVDGPEGCLSIPGRRGNVLRSESVVISYVKIPEMTTVTEPVSGYTARIFQHECDHLDGVLYIDKLTPADIQ